MSKNNKLVSVIMPYFKKKNYFIRSFNSAYNQSYIPLEIIIIYDDTEKEELFFIKKFLKGKKKRNIKILINRKNYGAGISRNKGIKFSKGAYIAFLDCDDYWKKSKIKKQVDFMKKNSYCATHTSYKIFDSSSKNQIIRTAKKKLSFSDLVNSCDIGLSTVVLKKSIIKKNMRFPNLKTKEDYVMWLKISKKSIFYGIDSVLTTWLKVNDSLSSNLIQKLLDGYLVYRKFLKYSAYKSLIRLLVLSINFLKKN
jgi:teichuronic acid biosynthesis glycosyltransferase TuaG